jgi:hypothetical protein
MALHRARRPGFVAAVSDLYPGLIEEARDIIESSEKEFEKRRTGKNGGFLWEHTVHVASLAHDLARSEGRDPVLPAVAALFHDAGKFRGGEYHRGDRPEEEDASALAASSLKRSGARAPDIAKVRRAIRALYDERARRDSISDLVHDADFLSKFGYLGVAAFFLKSALRGKNLIAAVMSSLSKELTYAHTLPRNMRTAAGRKAAIKRSGESLRFFRGLLEELEETRGTRFRIRRARVAVPGRKGKPAGTADVLLVVPGSCDACGRSWRYDLSVVRGVKCRTLEARLRCAGCGDAYTISFCLPELKGETRL